MDTSLITEDILFLPYNFISTYHSAWYLIQRDDKKIGIILRGATHRERQISHDITYMWDLKKNGTNEHIHKTEIEALM